VAIFDIEADFSAIRSASAKILDASLDSDEIALPKGVLKPLVLVIVVPHRPGRSSEDKRGC
jgi:hypothetical protein